MKQKCTWQHVGRTCGRHALARQRDHQANYGSQALLQPSAGYECLLPHCSTVLFCSPLTAHCSLPSASSARPQGNSPLYSSRPYEARAPSGLPKRLNGVGIDQKLNEQLPLDLVLKNENGETVKLGDYFGKKPVVLSLVYYQCPMLCNQVLNGMVTAFRVMSFYAGQ